jgi:hypothetical protein
MALFKRKDKQETKKEQPAPQAVQQMQAQPQVMQINLVDVVKQASVQMKYEEIGSWLMMHKTPLFFCHEKGLSIVDKSFIEDRPWLKKALGKMIKEIDEHRTKLQQQAQGMPNMQVPAIDTKADKEPKTQGYIG